MFLPQTSQYALRALGELAALPAGQSLRAKDISETTGIPQQYLSKVLRKLTVRKLLLADKGHGGGFRLARPASKIRFVDVLVALNPPPAPGRCVFGNAPCSPNKPCLLHPSFWKLNHALVDWATRSTLADLPRPKAKRTSARARPCSTARNS